MGSTGSYNIYSTLFKNIYIQLWVIKNKRLLIQEVYGAFNVEVKMILFKDLKV